MRQIQRSLQTFVRSLALLWLAAPGATVFLLVSRLLQGLAPAASVWIVKQVVDTVSAALNQEVAPAVLLIVLIPQGYIAFRLEETAWEVAEGKSHQLRRMEYYSSVMLTDTYAKEVRLFGLGTFLVNRYRQAFTDWHRAKRQVRTRRAWLSTASATASATVNALIFYWVVQQALQGHLSLGNVLLFIQSLLAISAPCPIWSGYSMRSLELGLPN